ncbi:unnamed protein product, partial [Nesidiocoris tenuis]
STGAEDNSWTSFISARLSAIDPRRHPQLPKSTNTPPRKISKSIKPKFRDASKSEKLGPVKPPILSIATRRIASQFVLAAIRIRLPQNDAARSEGTEGPALKSDANPFGPASQRVSIRKNGDVTRPVHRRKRRATAGASVVGRMTHAAEGDGATCKTVLRSSGMIGPLKRPAMSKALNSLTSNTAKKHRRRPMARGRRHVQDRQDTAHVYALRSIPQYFHNCSRSDAHFGFELHFTTNTRRGRRSHQES